MKLQFAPANLANQIQISLRRADGLRGVESLYRVVQLALLLWLSISCAGVLAHAIMDAVLLLNGLVL